MFDELFENTKKLSERFGRVEETTKSEVIELLKQGKVIYGVRENENNPGEYLVGEISDLEEYEKSGYWDIVSSVPSIEEAEMEAKEFAARKDGIYIGVQD